MFLTNLLTGRACDGFEHVGGFWDLDDKQRADGVDVGGLAHRDDVVLARDRVGRRDSAGAFHLLGDLEGSPGRRVDQDISLHAATPKFRPARTTSAYLCQRDLRARIMTSSVTLAPDRTTTTFSFGLGL